MTQTSFYAPADPRPPVPVTGKASRSQDGGTVNVGPRADLRLSQAERCVLASSSVQRMARLRQTGLAYLAVPRSEHSRLVHCLGTVAWVSRIFAALKANDPPRARRSQRVLLDRMDASLGGVGATERIARLYALVHDSSLLPLGHTIRVQLGFSSPKTAVAPLLVYQLAAIRAELEDAAAAQLAAADERLERLAELRHDLDLVEWVVRAEQLLAGKILEANEGSIETAEFYEALPALSFISELVTGPLSADILDYTARDLNAVDMRFCVSSELLSSLAVIQSNIGIADMWIGGRPLPVLNRFGLQLNRAAVGGLGHLLRARYEIARRIFFHPGKLVADAMLDVALRRIDAATQEVSACTNRFTPEHLLSLGDDAFLDEVHTAERWLAPDTRPFMAELLSGRLLVPIAAITYEGSSPPSRVMIARAMAPAERDRIDALARQRLGNDQVCCLCTPESMQFKPAGIVGIDDSGGLAIIEELAAGGAELQDIAELRDFYRYLWTAAILGPPSLLDGGTHNSAEQFLVSYFRRGPGSDR